MKKYSYPFILLFLLLHACDSTCPLKEAQNLMGNWYLKPLIFPDGLRLLNQRLTEKGNNFDIKKGHHNKFILHYFLADCDKCVNELAAIQAYLGQNKEKYNDVSFVFVATGPVDNYVKDAIQKLHFSYPVYFERDYQSFKLINKLPLDDKLYDTMLVDEKNQLLIFGAFYNNLKAEKLYTGILNCED